MQERTGKLGRDITIGVLLLSIGLVGVMKSESKPIKGAKDSAWIGDHNLLVVLNEDDTVDVSTATTDPIRLPSGVCSVTDVFWNHIDREVVYLRYLKKHEFGYDMSVDVMNPATGEITKSYHFQDYDFGGYIISSQREPQVTICGIK